MLQIKKQSQFVAEIDKLARKLGHKGVEITLANKIYNLVLKTISSRLNNKYVYFSVECLVDELILTIKLFNKIISEMDKFVRELSKYNVINETPECGKELTSGVIVEIWDVRRFKNAWSIIAYA